MVSPILALMLGMLLLVATTSADDVVNSDIKGDAKDVAKEDNLSILDSIIARDEDAKKYRTIADINTKGTRVIVNPGGTNEKFARANFPNATMIENGENLSVFTKIRDGKADVMVTDAIETIIQSKIHPELMAVNPGNPFNYFELGYLLPRDVVFKAYVDQWLSQLKFSGDFDRVQKAALNAVVAQAKAQKKR